MGTSLITLDTSGVFALLNRRDPDHERTKEALFEDRGPYLVPVGILAEAGEGDIGRIRELIARYADLPLGFADACVISCAERNGGKVLTLDLRHFGVVAREGHISIHP